jgi:hypothetical protein
MDRCGIDNELSAVQLVPALIVPERRIEVDRVHTSPVITGVTQFRDP